MRWFTALFVVAFGDDRLNVSSRFLGHKLEFESTVELGLTVLDVSVLVLYVAFLATRMLFLKHPNAVWRMALTPEECGEIRDWFRTGKDAHMPKTYCRTKYATLDDVHDLTRLNFAAFKSSAFATPPERLKERNESWIKRNRKIFLLMFDPTKKREELMGYCSLLPLNEEGKRMYVSGQLKDSDIPAALVVKTGERPAALLFFAVVLDQKYSLAKSGADRCFSIYFMSCLRRHLKDMYPKLLATGKYPPLYAQTEEGSLRRKMEAVGFVSAEARTADGFDLLVLKKPFQKTDRDSAQRAAS